MQTTVSFVAWLEKPARCHFRESGNYIKRVMRAIPIFEINNHLGTAKVVLEYRNLHQQAVKSPLNWFIPRYFTVGEVVVMFRA
ncbi:hypothetical protein RHHCN13_00060 [Rickettsia conorii subsp. heilongjiangensis]|uniref:Uncharacterized protein n=1 Tax=Rickettsia conorii subsp. heilongjiangensis TaxID=226665 RepID=A0AAD1GHR9_RICCR|nr:hypothetical protein RHCH81_00060 [Rickettsia conorii subsp. heilongjiangensis]BBM92059.1 hypothetical protein RHHCN13_00060 [Rickettsia conorii subsp. heilongjiangensis]BBM93268.1 hypothetical protein RHSENDAI29_00060 [Rickettsia conorii subsp. heilongjiangensis]BBM94477.1 hypothetical protein RHSENDAI58_00060 [Rickettsia conorii subsp. heilongjiangensis]